VRGEGLASPSVRVQNYLAFHTPPKFQVDRGEGLESYVSSVRYTYVK
jgi:hypothetical protein